MDYMVWTYHGENKVTVGHSSRGNLTSSTVELVGRQPASSSTAPAASNDNVIVDILQDMGTNNDGGGDGYEDAAMKDLESAEFMAKIAYRFDEDDILFGNSRWLENFREMK